MSSKSWPKVRHVRPLNCHLCCSSPSSGDVVKPLSTYGQLQFALAIIPKFLESAMSAGEDVQVEG
ncbi:hypothetical protein DPMN_122145 [Dreissena polymorpha]|uniref:Uncharacterized protein n=1 Tax=Dreissena polymorpha TaxID=45954 RepID=A0A9D4JRQ4_DREPO|nr:hypothetical protein DPMN_122145 [Dreissena polymorpha]